MAGAITSTGPDTATAVGNALSYFWGQCTRWVAEHLSWIGPSWGNAWQWIGSAQKHGLTTIAPTLAPPIGSVAVWGPNLPGSGGAGHVAIVTGQLPGGGFTVSEENWLGAGLTDTRKVTDTNYLEGFILPPNSSAPLSSAITSQGQLVPADLSIGGIAGAIGSASPLGLLAQIDPGIFGQIGSAGGQVAGGIAGGVALGVGEGLGAGLGSAFTGVGHGLANALGASVEDVGIFFRKQIIALMVAVVVAFILFG